MIGIGYQGLPLSDLIEQLRADDVKVLVDVRLNAISRKFGYSKRALATALEAADIRYLHDPRLGNPRENRAGYSDSTSAHGIAARHRFEALLETGAGAEGIRDLASLVEQESVAVLCYEADENHCHRQQVMAAVRQKYNSPATSSLHSG